MPIHRETPFASGHTVRWKVRVVEDRPEWTRTIFELVSRFGLAPLRVVLVRAVPCTCATRDDHTAACAVSRAPHPQQVMLEDVIIGPQRFRFVSAAVLEPASVPSFASAA